jgi:hypothetical protein
MRNSSRWFSCCLLVGLGAAAWMPAAAMADPSISGLSNDHVPLKSFLTIYGSGFGDAQGQSTVLIGSHHVPVLAWSTLAIHVFVDPMAYSQGPLVLDATYPVQVIVPSADHPNSNVVNLTITSAPPPVYPPDTTDQTKESDQPSIGGFQTGVFCPGNEIGIYGSAFGTAMGTGYVSVTVPFLDAQGNSFTQEVQIPVVLWSDGAIDAVLLLPPGAQPGSYTVTVHRANGKTASGHFTVGPCH